MQENRLSIPVTSSEKFQAEIESVKKLTLEQNSFNLFKQTFSMTFFLNFLLKFSRML